MKLPFGFRLVRDRPRLHPVSLAQLHLSSEDVKQITNEVHAELLRIQKRNGEKGMGIR